MSAGVVFQQMMVIFLLVITGYAVCRKGMVKPEISRGISALVVNICNPALLITSAFERDSSQTSEKLLIAAGTGMVIYIIFLLSSVVFPRIMRVEAKWKKHYSLMCIFGNTGFIGVPLVSAVLGPQCLIYVSIMIAYYNLIFYTYGIMLADDGKSKFLWKNFLNMGNLAIIIVLILFFFQPEVPVVFRDVLDHMAETTTFLAMFVVGINLAQSNLLSIFSDKKMYLFVALRFLLLPIGVSLVLKNFVTDPMIYGTMVLMCALPVGNLPLMRVEEKGGNGEVLSRGMLLSTILSVLTIPLVTLFV